MKKRENTKELLMEVMGKLDKSFKTNLNEDFTQPTQQTITPSLNTLQVGLMIKFINKNGTEQTGVIRQITNDTLAVKIEKPEYDQSGNLVTFAYVPMDKITQVLFQNKWYSKDEFFKNIREEVSGKSDIEENDFQDAVNKPHYGVENGTMQKAQPQKSMFKRWYDGQESGHGSFHTALLKLFLLGSSGNKQKLQQAFPEVFSEEDLRSF